MRVLKMRTKVIHSFRLVIDLYIIKPRDNWYEKHRVKKFIHKIRREFLRDSTNNNTKDNNFNASLTG